MQVALFVALLLALPAHAMNKCVDANGKITYQQDPCPGKVVRAAPTPPVEAPVAPAAPAAEAPAAKPAPPVIVQGNTACERVRQQIAEIRESMRHASNEAYIASDRVIERAKKDYAYCGDL